MREKLQRFMAGRYGADQFSKFLSTVTIILLLISMFTKWSLLYTVAVVLLLYTYMRMFSKNHSKRYAENMKYLKVAARVRSFFGGQRGTGNGATRTHRIYRCPSCKQKIRVPRGKGRIAIRCPKCSVEFIRKS